MSMERGEEREDEEDGKKKKMMRIFRDWEEDAVEKASSEEEIARRASARPSKLVESPDGPMRGRDWPLVRWSSRATASSNHGRGRSWFVLFCLEQRTVVLRRGKKLWLYGVEVAEGQGREAVEVLRTACTMGFGGIEYIRVCRHLAGVCRVLRTEYGVQVATHGKFERDDKQSMVTMAICWVCSGV